MPRYSKEIKMEALQKIAELGVQKTAEIYQISVPTLYKWRSEYKNPTRINLQANLPEDLRQMLAEDKTLAQKFHALEAENQSLRAENQQLYEKLLQLRSVVISMMG